MTTRTRPRKWSRKKKFFLFFFVEFLFSFLFSYFLDRFLSRVLVSWSLFCQVPVFLFSYFLVFFYKFPPLELRRKSSLQLARCLLFRYIGGVKATSSPFLNAFYRSTRDIMTITNNHVHKDAQQVHDNDHQGRTQKVVWGGANMEIK